DGSVVTEGSAAGSCLSCPVPRTVGDSDRGTACDRASVGTSEGDRYCRTVRKRRLRLGDGAGGGQIEFNIEVVLVGSERAVGNVSARVGLDGIRPVGINERRLDEREGGDCDGLRAGASDIQCRAST